MGLLARIRLWLAWRRLGLKDSPELLVGDFLRSSESILAEEALCGAAAAAATALIAEHILKLLRRALEAAHEAIVEVLTCERQLELWLYRRLTLLHTKYDSVHIKVRPAAPPAAGPSSRPFIYQPSSWNHRGRFPLKG